MHARGLVSSPLATTADFKKYTRASATDRSSILTTHKVRSALFSLWHQTLAHQPPGSHRSTHLVPVAAQHSDAQHAGALAAAAPAA